MRTTLEKDICRMKSPVIFSQVVRFPFQSLRFVVLQVCTVVGRKLSSYTYKCYQYGRIQNILRKWDGIIGVMLRRNSFLKDDNPPCDRPAPNRSGGRIAMTLNS